MKIVLRNKNIIILIKSFALGGAERQALYLASFLQDRMECIVHIYSYMSAENSVSFLEECRKLKLNNLYLTDNPFNASGKFKYFKQRVKIFFFGMKLRKHKPYIIIPYLNPPSIIASLCYKIAGADITFWHHRGPDFYRKNLLEKKAVEKCPLFIANSLGGVEELKNEITSPKNKTYFIPNFSTIGSKEMTNENIIIKNARGKVVIGMIAHFRIQKLQLVLLKAFKNMIDKGLEVYLMLAGDVVNNDEEMLRFSKIKDFINKNQLHDYVSVFHHTKAEQLLSNFDIGVLVSIKEGMPNSVMEYMAYQLPVVATKHDGVVSLLGESYEYFIENNTVQELESILQKLVLDKKLRNRIGLLNKERLTETFSISAYMKRLTSILNR